MNTMKHMQDRIDALEAELTTRRLGHNGSSWCDTEGVDYWRDYWRERALRTQDERDALSHARSAIIAVASMYDEEGRS